MTRRQLNPSIGVLLLDAQLRAVHHTSEAAAILEYPQKPSDIPPLDKVLPVIHALLADPTAPVPPPSLEFRSGRRRYQCRAFQLDPNASNRHVNAPKIVVILERSMARGPDVAKWCEEFQLTTRESETVMLLLRGLTSKEIADEMRISPSTVKSFLKLVMTKVGATSRTGIIAKILEEGIVILFLNLN
jgi:DNA-binding CsgD family transcriptional regulator